MKVILELENHADYVALAAFMKLHKLNTVDVKKFRSNSIRTEKIYSSVADVLSRFNSLSSKELFNLVPEANSYRNFNRQLEKLKEKGLISIETKKCSNTRKNFVSLINFKNVKE